VRHAAAQDARQRPVADRQQAQFPSLAPQPHEGIEQKRQPVARIEAAHEGKRVAVPTAARHEQLRVDAVGDHVEGVGVERRDTTPAGLTDADPPVEACQFTLKLVGAPEPVLPAVPSLWIVSVNTSCAGFPPVVPVSVFVKT